MFTDYKKVAIPNIYIYISLGIYDNNVQHSQWLTSLQKTDFKKKFIKVQNPLTRFLGTYYLLE